MTAVNGKKLSGISSNIFSATASFSPKSKLGKGQSMV